MPDSNASHLSSAVYIVAEAGVNHNGSIELAKQMIDVAVESGADAVKFQTFKASSLATSDAPKAQYQIRSTGEEDSQTQMLKKLELDEEKHKELVHYCSVKGIDFLSTPFDLGSLTLLVGELGLSRIKISSGDITNAPLLFLAARASAAVILSTGMSTLTDVEMALGVLSLGYLLSDRSPSLQAFQDAYHSQEGQQALREKVVLLHCTTEYPAPLEDVNLRAMITLHRAFGLPVGYSDHTTGIAVPIAATALGAVVLEKHFTLDRSLPGPDHKASLEPGELRRMVKSVREVEKAMGSPLKVIARSERENRTIARKSLVASRTIAKGERFSEKNLAVKRPGSGISPVHYWEWLDRIAQRSFEPDELISYETLDE